MAPKKISAKDVLIDIRAGMSNNEIGEKYKLSAKGTQSLFNKLLSANLISKEDHRRRVVSSTQSIDLLGDNGGDAVLKQEITIAAKTPRVDTKILEGQIEDDDKALHAAPPTGCELVGSASQPYPSSQETQKDSVPEPNEFIDVSKQGRNRWWRYLVSILFMVFFSSLMMAVTAGYASRLTGSGSFNNYIAHNLGMVFLLISLFLAVRFEHKRPFLSLITANRSIDWRKAGTSLAVFFGLLTVASVLDYILNPETHQFSLNPGRFFLWAPVVLILTPIQTTTEELLFRGYLLQGMALLTRNRCVLVLVSGVLFMLPHLLNPEVAAGFLPMALYYFATGCFLTIVTLKSNGLEVAIGIHAAMNLFCALVVNYANSSLTTESIFFCTEINPIGSLLSFCIQAIVFYLLIFGSRTTLQKILHYPSTYWKIGSSQSSQKMT